MAGLGILFIGMDMMETMQPLCDSQVFPSEAMTKFEHPLLGILAGAAFTAAIQSSLGFGRYPADSGTGGAVSFDGGGVCSVRSEYRHYITAVLAAIRHQEGT